MQETRTGTTVHLSKGDADAARELARLWSAKLGNKVTIHDAVVMAITEKLRELRKAAKS